MNLKKEDIIIFIKQNKKTILLSILSSILIAFLAIYLINNINKKNDYSEVNNYLVNKNNEEQSTENKEQSKTIFIDIKGTVKNPGVYEFSKENRIKDAIEKAGGLLEDADVSKINLSQKLKDQMLIIIPKKGEKTSITSQENSMSKTININLATKEELMKINGIGETKAKAIIEYRESKGEFKNKEEIMKVKGIGKGTYEKIKDEIEV